MAPDTIVFLLTFVSVALLTFGAYNYFTREREIQRKIEQRAIAFEVTERAEFVDLMRRNRATMSGLFGGNFDTLQDWLLQSGLPLNSWRYLGGALAFLVISTALFATLFRLGAVAFLVGPLLTLAGVVAAIAIARRIRIAKFDEQLPDAIDVIARGLRAGYPLQTAVALISKEIEDPAGTEFRTVLHEISFGLDIESAVKNLARRVGSSDLLFLVTAVVVQTQAGGNLAEVLDRLSYTMRERAKLRLKIHALTSEGRYTAILLTFLPPGLGVVLYLINPNYYLNVWHEPLFENLMYSALIMLVIGNFILRRMVKFKY